MWRAVTFDAQRGAERIKKTASLPIVPKHSRIGTSASRPH